MKTYVEKSETNTVSYSMTCIDHRVIHHLLSASLPKKSTHQSPKNLFQYCDNNRLALCQDLFRI